MNTQVILAIRPKTNSSYTAKKAIIVAKLNLPFEPSQLNLAQDGTEWHKVSVSALDEIYNDMKAHVIESAKTLSIIPDDFSTPDTGGPDVMLRAIQCSVMYRKIANTQQQKIDELATNISTLVTLESVKAIFELNSNIEFVAHN